MIKINCGALPPTLIESELFGQTALFIKGYAFFKKGVVSTSVPYHLTG
jgi:DNA-binding NtrC family response regulator